MKPRTKDRLLTAGTVLLICAVGLATPGCSTSPPQTKAQRDLQHYFTSMCTTDTDCEMHEQFGTKHSDREDAMPRWKLWTTIGIGVLVTGYLYAQRSEAGAQQGVFGTDKSIQPVTCVANGCAK